MAIDADFRVLSAKLWDLVAMDRELSQGAKLLFDKIRATADWARGRTGLCFPGYSVLAEMVGRSVRMIGNYLRELRERGYLSWARTQRCPNIYFLNFDLVSADPPSIPEKFVLAKEGYAFAGGSMYQRGLRERLTGAALMKSGQPAGTLAAPSRGARQGSLFASAGLLATALFRRGSNDV